MSRFASGKCHVSNQYWLVGLLYQWHFHTIWNSITAFYEGKMHLLCDWTCPASRFLETSAILTVHNLSPPCQLPVQSVSTGTKYILPPSLSSFVNDSKACLGWAQILSQMSPGSTMNELNKARFWVVYEARQGGRINLVPVLIAFTVNLFCHPPV